MRDSLFLAPLQSFTDYHFRNAFQEVLGDVDRFYAPYLKMAFDGTMKEGPKLDVLPQNNPFERVVPQIMACCAEDFLVMASYLEDLGYDEVNWNLGCPYPMVAKRDLGSGILNKPSKICSILDDVQQKTPLKIGIKMRMGYENTSDILDLLPQLNNYELTEIIVHARYGKQLYAGGCDHDRFTECIPLTNHSLIYNGDITTVSEFRKLKKLFPSIDKWMIGRGAIANPFLFEMIQEDTDSLPDDYISVFSDFLMLLLESHLQQSSNHGNVLLKMTHYWEYFSSNFLEGKKLARIVKKSKSISDYSDFITNLDSFI
jgi:tRNA-dihydrouridine synthase